MYSRIKTVSCIVSEIVCPSLKKEAGQSAPDSTVEKKYLRSSMIIGDRAI